MIFNTNKCKCMMLSKKRHPPTPSLYLNSQQLELVKCYKYLGVCIESDLSWNTHITEICKKAKKIMGLIYRKISLHTDPQVMAKLYIQQIRPHLEYGAPIWHPYLFFTYLCPGKSTKVCSKDVFRGMDLQLRGST